MTRAWIAALLLLPAAAAAQQLPQDDLGILLGLGVRSRPDYDGASKQELEPIPVIRYYGETLFARTTQGILEGGGRREFFPGFAAGIQFAYEEGNDRTGLDAGASVGLHAEWDTKVGPAPFNLLGRVRYHVDDSYGIQYDLRASVGAYASPSLKAWVFGQATWATDEWLQAYYTAGSGGLLFTQLGVEGTYDLSRHWVALASVSVRRLHGDAASSPITEEKTNTYASAGVAYRF